MENGEPKFCDGGLRVCSRSSKEGRPAPRPAASGPPPVGRKGEASGTMEGSISRREKAGRCLLAAIPSTGDLALGSMLLALLANWAILACKEGGMGVDTGC